MSELEEAKDRVMMGPERRSLVLDGQGKALTAYHEAGHAIAAKLRARGRRGAQGHHHPARPRAGRDLHPAGEDRFTQLPPTS